MKIDEQIPFSNDIEENRKALKKIFSDTDDVVFRSFIIGKSIEAEIIYFEGLSAVREIQDHVLSPLMEMDLKEQANLEEIQNVILPIASVSMISSLTDGAAQMLRGFPILYINGVNQALCLKINEWEKRAVEEPKTEISIRGSREGFTESIGTNTALLRRRIQSIHLKMKAMNIGTYTNTRVIVAHIEGIARPALVDEVWKRLNRIDIDSILESGYIEELTEDDPFSPFPQEQFTERVDVVSANLLEGRVAILVDGTPDVLVVPVTLTSLLQAVDDYYNRALYSSMVRMLRYGTLFIALILPAVYVALINYHQEMLPTKLLISITAARSAVPFPAIVETFVMQLAFEALREAGLRLPRQIGSAVTIVGALVVGEAAVSAGFVSAPMVIIVAFTGIASFTAPHYSLELAIRFLRLPLIILGGTLGMLGIMFGIIAIAIHLCSLRSFGVPFMAPFAPLRINDLKDSAIRVPWWLMSKRPSFLGRLNKYRLGRDQKPGPTKGE